MMAEKLPGAKADKADQTLASPLAGQWAEVVTILGGTLGNVETKAIIDKLASTLLRLEEETLQEITLQSGG